MLANGGNHKFLRGRPRNLSVAVHNARGHAGAVADLEEMALKRDRGYLVRLVLALGAAVIAAAFVFAGLTGESFAGCVAEVFVGQPERPPTAPQ